MSLDGGLRRGLVLQVIGGALSWRHYAGLPPLPPAPEGEMAWPRVSIVIPARDEATRLPALLASLRALDYPDYETIVVDDDSSDGTAAVAASYGVRVVCSGPLPLGWAGKTFACQQGAAVASGAWLLFTDADTVHAPASLRAAVAYARRHGLGALSVMTGQRCVTPVERLVVPLAYALLFAGLAPQRINRTHGAAPFANGQYMLYAREAYTTAGGHAAAHGSVIEDAVLARRLHERRIPYCVCRGESLVTVRLYSNLAELWTGFRKNAVGYAFDDPPRLIGTTLWTVAMWEVAPLLVLALASRRRGRIALALLNYALAAGSLVPWYRRCDLPARYAALCPAGVVLLGGISLDAVWRLLSRRGISWKGRTYL